MTTEKRSCVDCMFSVPSQTLQNGQPVVGQYTYRCHFGPPQIMVLPQQGGFAVGAQFPEVTADISCAQWRPKPDSTAGIAQRPPQ